MLSVPGPDFGKLINLHCGKNIRKVSRYNVTQQILDVLTIEVGSTITKVNGFRRLPEGGFEHGAQGFAPTSVAAGDVGIGVEQAIIDLEARHG